MKIKDLKTKNEKELKSLYAEKAQALRAFRFAVAGSNARNVKEGHALKKSIAQIKTLLNNKVAK